MPSRAEAVSVLVALEVVVVAAVLFLVLPVEVVASLVPLVLVFLVALSAYRYRS